MTRMLDINEAYVAFNGGAFDSRSRFVRQPVSSPSLTMVSGSSLGATRYVDDARDGVAWRWQVGSATFHGQVRDGFPSVVVLTQGALSNGAIGVTL